MPLLLTESLDPVRRELTHQHIESCADCTDEWIGFRETWSLLEVMPEVTVPARVKANFLAQVMPQSAQTTVASTAEPSNVVPFQRRPAFKWLAQAAAVVILAGGSYFVGNRNKAVVIAPTHANLISAQPVAYSLAESRVLPASAMSPQIQGRPDIRNVRFDDADPSDQKIGVSFDITQRVTVTGSPADKSMIRLLAYVLEGEGQVDPSRSRAIEWVRQTYSDPAWADPEIAGALAKVLRSDSHEGVRIQAVETLQTLPPAMALQSRDALIEALKSDPNPAVRIKAVEALSKMIRNGETLDSATVDTLRQKASQDDENLYVRVKAAEALNNIQPR